MTEKKCSFAMPTLICLMSLKRKMMNLKTMMNQKKMMNLKMISSKRGVTTQ